MQGRTEMLWPAAAARHNIDMESLRRQAEADYQTSDFRHWVRREMQKSLGHRSPRQKAAKVQRLMDDWIARRMDELIDQRIQRGCGPTDGASRSEISAGDEGGAASGPRTPSSSSPGAESPLCIGDTPSPAVGWGSPLKEWPPPLCYLS